MTLRFSVIVTTLFALAPVLPGPATQQASKGNTPPTRSPATATPVTHLQDDDGDEVWRQQCSRCHNAPEGFSPRISGTVIRHMRVRASLSKHEEQELLHFLNP